MDDIAQFLQAIDQGDPHAAEQLLPLVYDELRKLGIRCLRFAAGVAPGPRKARFRLPASSTGWD